MILTVILEGICRAATVLSALLKVFSIPCRDRSYINFMLVLQSFGDSLHILPSLSCDTNAASSDCAYHVGNMKFEEDVDMQGEEWEVNVKTEKGIGSEEEECTGIKVEEGIYSEEEEDIDINEEVSLEGTVL